MDPQNEKIIRDQMETLPPEINQALANFDWSSKIQEIGNKYSLHIDQIGALQTEILLVLIGLVDPDDFGTELKSNLNLPEEKLQAMEKDAEEMIFVPIRKSLVQIYEDQLADVEVEEGENLNREELIQSIENPPQTKTQNMAEEKMIGSFRMPKQESDYSVIKDIHDKGAIEDSAQTPPPYVDPYKEKI